MIILAILNYIYNYDHPFCYLIDYLTTVLVITRQLSSPLSYEYCYYSVILESRYQTGQKPKASDEKHINFMTGTS